MMICMLKLNATVWQQKLNKEDIGGQNTCSEGLNMEYFRQKETGKAKMTLRKTFEGETKDIHREKGVAVLS